MEIDDQRFDNLSLVSTGDARMEGGIQTYDWINSDGKPRNAWVISAGATHADDARKEGVAMILMGKAKNMFQHARNKTKGQGWKRISGRLMYVDMLYPGIGMVRTFILYLPPCTTRANMILRQNTWTLLKEAYIDAKKDPVVKATQWRGDWNSRIDTKAIPERTRGEYCRNDKVFKLKVTHNVRIGAREFEDFLTFAKLRCVHGQFEPKHDAPPGTWFHLSTINTTKKWYTPDHTANSKRLWFTTTDAGVIPPKKWNIDKDKTPDHCVLYEIQDLGLSKTAFWQLQRAALAIKKKKEHSVWIPPSEDWTPTDIKMYSTCLIALMADEKEKAKLDKTSDLTWATLKKAMITACQTTFPKRPEERHEHITSWQVEAHRRRKATGEGETTTKEDEKLWNKRRRQYQRTTKRRKVAKTIKYHCQRMTGMRPKVDINAHLSTEVCGNHLKKLYGEQTLTQYVTLPIIGAYFHDIRHSTENSNLRLSLKRLQEGKSDKMINKIIDKLKDVACGPDGIPPRLWRLSANNARDLLVDMVTRTFAEDDHTAKPCNENAINHVLVKWLHKKNDKTDPANYRTIGCSATSRKVIMRVFLHLFEPLYLKFMHPSQGAFQPGIGSDSFARMTAEVIHAAKSAGLTLSIAYIDGVKAYDVVPRSTLLSIFRDGFKLPKAMMRVLEQLYTGVAFVTEGNTFDERSFTETFRGVVQGCAGSPVLFNCLMEYGRRCYERQRQRHTTAEEKKFDIAFNAEFEGHKMQFRLGEVFFADDMSVMRLARRVESVLGNNEAMSNASTLFMDEIEKRTGMHANYAKEKSSASTYGAPLPDDIEIEGKGPHENDPVIVQGHPLKRDIKVKHLGRYHVEKSGCGTDMLERQHSAAFAFQRWRGVLMSKNIPVKKRVSYFAQLVESVYLATAMTWAPTTSQWKELDTWILLHLKKVIGWVGERYWRKTNTELMTKLDKIIGRQYVPASTKVRIRRINRIGTGAVKIYKAIDKGSPPPLHEMIVYATLDNNEGKYCRRAYISAGAQSRWAPVAAGKNGVRRTTPGSSGLSWRAAAQADMDYVGLHESREQCYINEHGIGQIGKWKRIAARLNDLPHLGHYTSNTDKTITRHRSEQSLAASAKRKQRAIEQATVAGLRPATGARTSPAGTVPTAATRTTKTRRRKRPVKVTEGHDKNGTRIKPGDIVHVERGKYKGRDYIIDSFSSKERCRLQVGGGNATTLVVKTTQVRLVRRGQ